MTGVVDRPPGLVSPAAFFLPWFTGQANVGSLTPGNLQFVVVTGRFFTFSGSPASGTVTFTPVTLPLTDAPAHQIYDGSTVATLDGSGAISVSVVCTGNTDLVPSSWTYTITTTLSGVVSSYPGKLIPYSPLSTVDLSAILP